MNDSIGLGVISYAHPHAAKYAAAIAGHRRSELAGIATLDANSDQAAAEAEAYGVPFYMDYRNLVDREDVIGVYLGSEPGRHLKLIQHAAAKGKHVLCDKPLALALEEADEMVRVARSAGIKLMVPFNPRYQLPLRNFKQALDAGEAGELLSISAVKYGKLPTGMPGSGTYDWLLDLDRAGGGGFLDIGIHALDALRWLSGSEPRSIYAEIGIKVHEGLKVDDFGAAIINFENGVFGSLSAGWVNPWGYPSWLDVRFEILTTSGAWLIDSPYHDYQLYSKDRAERVPWWRVDVDGLISDFVEAILEDREPAITGEDGRAALAIALAAYESAQKREVVEFGRWDRPQSEDGQG